MASRDLPTDKCHTETFNLYRFVISANKHFLSSIVKAISLFIRCSLITHRGQSDYATLSTIFYEGSIADL